MTTLFLCKCQLKSVLIHIRVGLIKTDSTGDTIWTKTYHESGDYGQSVAQTADGGYVVVGSTRSFGAGNIDVYLIKTNCAG